MGSIVSIFITAVFAGEGILSPLPEDVLHTLTMDTISSIGSIQKPTQTFGELSQQDVLGDFIEISPTPLPTETPTPASPQTPSQGGPTPTPPVYHAKKSAVTIALLGDSMMDTMGPDAPALKSILTKTFPGTQFTIKNYGVGGTNIDYGIERITSGYTYLGNPIPALSAIKPDIVVVESFGYNPFPFDNAMDKHWLSLAKAVDTLRSAVPGVKIVIGSTIAPNWDVFGDGAPGVSFSQEAKKRHVETVKQYLENAVKFATSQKFPLANAYYASLDKNGNGKLAYINSGDHIHYSDAGRSLFAQKIAGAIINNKLLE